MSALAAIVVALLVCGTVVTLAALRYARWLEKPEEPTADERRERKRLLQHADELEDSAKEMLRSGMTGSADRALRRADELRKRASE